jgi:hypothetical protein
VRGFEKRVKKEGEKYPNLKLMASYESAEERQQLTIDEMRLIKEILEQADMRLKTSINDNVETFIAQVRKNSTLKGCKWDDIVFKFEYSVTEVPLLC